MYDSILKNTSLLVNSYEFQTKYTFKYEACITSTCRDVTDVVTADAAKSKKLLILNGSLTLDKTSTFAQNSKFSGSFFDTFMRIRYDDKIGPVINATPNSIQDKYILQVDENATKASKLDLVITIRNKKYILNLR